MQAPGPDTNEAPTATAGGTAMAHLDYTEFGSDSLRWFCNVTMAVGPVGTAPNRLDDVLLVQYFMKKAAEYTKRFSLEIAGWWDPPDLGRPFRVDGLMGPDTASWIKSYQQAVARSGYSVLVDGRIDRAHSSTSTISNTVYTILWLNMDFRAAHPDKFEALEDDVEAPPELRGAIRASRESDAGELVPTGYPE
jgi:hypothetical protein